MCAEGMVSLFLEMTEKRKETNIFSLTDVISAMIPYVLCAMIPIAMLMLPVL